MAKGYSLHIGLNEVDPEAEQYDGWAGKLAGPEADAHTMYNIARGLNYECSLLLLGNKATRANFYKEVKNIQAKLQKGDLFLLTFAGHGGQIPDKNGDEMDGLDETWCLYDAQLVDDELYGLLQTFETGIRILIVSDSCFSGDILRKDESDGDPIFGQGRNDKIDLPNVKASVRLLASCQEHETSKEVRGRGLFTSILEETWDEGGFEGNYHDFYDAIVSEMPFNYDQTANHLWGGGEDTDFGDSTPFVV
ncbi:MAG: caspase family protein [Bacteroidota bacterium]